MLSVTWSPTVSDQRSILVQFLAPRCLHSEPRPRHALLFAAKAGRTRRCRRYAQMRTTTGNENRISSGGPAIPNFSLSLPFPCFGGSTYKSQKRPSIPSPTSKRVKQRDRSPKVAAVCGPLELEPSPSPSFTWCSWPVSGSFLSSSYSSSSSSSFPSLLIWTPVCGKGRSDVL